MIENLLNIIFPKICLRCSKQGEGYICSSCFKSFKNSIRLEKIYNKSYDYLVYLDRYKLYTRKNILAMKFSEKSYFVDFFVEIIYKSNEIVSFLKNFEYIIPVPMQKSKKLERGYNQTELLAISISKKLNIKCDYKSLIKTKENITQSLLLKEYRWENVKNVFEILNIKNIKDKKIILVDDIYTTGATVLECSNILKKAGASKICVLVVAKT